MTSAPKDEDSLLRELAVARRRLEEDPGNATCLLLLGLRYADLGQFHASRDVRAAREWALRDVRVREELVDLEPSNAGFAIGLACACNRLARLSDRRDPAESRTWRVRALEARERIAELEPRSRDARRGVASACANLGRLDGRFDPARGRTWFLRALGILESLVDEEPSSAEDLLELALARLGLARLEESLAPALGLRRLELCLEAMERHAALLPGDRMASVWLSIALEALGEAQERAAVAGAEEVFLREAARARALVSADPRDGDAHAGLAHACHRLGAFLVRSGRAEEAAPLRKEMSRALARATRLQGRRSSLEFLRACDLAVHGAATGALAALERAVALGFDDAEELLASLDLAPLRGKERFRLAFERIPGASPGTVS